MGHFQVLYSGEVVEGADKEAVRRNLARRLGVDDRKSQQLFSGRTVVIQSQMERESAYALQSELAKLGAIVRVKDLTPDERAKFKTDNQHRDHTLRDITAAHIECPRCGHLQLEAESCARCGIDIRAAVKQKQKEDQLIEKRIRELREASLKASRGAPRRGADPIIPKRHDV